GPALLQSLAVAPSSDLRKAADEAERNAQTVVYLVEERATKTAEILERSVVAAIAVADAIRPESRDAIASLHKMGIDVAMLTGDTKSVADAVAGALGIDTVFSEVLPEQKAGKIEELQRSGKRVAMV